MQEKKKKTCIRTYIKRDLEVTDGGFARNFQKALTVTSKGRVPSGRR